ncbi:MAG: SGNH/GDSL hydrolase family protein [Verrucomicrobiales bacterium]|nr:SGNH/GDSL hydrolase family protein [Verrucomicrobiales bacterium]
MRALLADRFGSESSGWRMGMFSVRLLSILTNWFSPRIRAAESEILFGGGEGERIILIGGGFAERLQYFGYFETLVFYHASANKPVIRNMAWSGDEVSLMPRPYNFIRSANTGEPDDPNPGYGFGFEPDSDHRILSAHLKSQEADTILLCFGAPESFRGAAGLDDFADSYRGLIDKLRGQKFNGESPPRLILVSPIAQEALGGAYPDPASRNKQLKLYVDKIAEIAEDSGLPFADLFGPTLAAMGEGEGSLTIDGLQLNDNGHRLVSEEMARALGITDPWSGKMDGLRKLVVEKNKQFFFRWRPINGEYVYGRRREPFGIVSYPPEMKKLDEMIAVLDESIHIEAQKLNSLP